MKRVLFLATTTGYQTRMFGEAAERLGVKLIFATDRCERLEDPWWDSAIPIRFYRETKSVEAILRAVQDNPPHGLLVVGDRATTIAAEAARRLNLPGHPRMAAERARDKRLMRECLRGAGLPVPWFQSLALDANTHHHGARLEYPVVVKPVMLSGSRGVIRANSAGEFTAAVERIERLLKAADVRAMRDPAAGAIQVESFIDGREYAVEAVLHDGELYTLAIFDKPDPLDGPFFEETLYVTPSRAGAQLQQDIVSAIRAATGALGLHHGPIHAECRVNDQGIFVLEVAARPIGGLCARALSFVNAAGQTIGLEELLLRHAIGEAPHAWQREPVASGVMMIPIPRAGVFRRVEGEGEARALPGITDLRITAKPDQQLVPLPEGSSYLGFIFAKGESAAAVEQALRDAHGTLTFVIDRALPLTTGA